ncbi:MAG: acylphosphatase [Alphaproteobacteria bacterium]|jgi:acylphosphatase
MASQNDEPEMMAIHVRIRGKVQRVRFRQWIVEEATKRGLRGWVRNRSDGTVEAVISGEMNTVRAMVRTCYQGPPKAEVRQVVQIPGEYRPTDDDFGPEFKILESI